MFDHFIMLEDGEQYDLYTFRCSKSLSHDRLRLFGRPHFSRDDEQLSNGDRDRKEELARAIAGKTVCRQCDGVMKQETSHRTRSFGEILYSSVLHYETFDELPSDAKKHTFRCSCDQVHAFIKIRNDTDPKFNWPHNVDRCAVYTALRSGQIRCPKCNGKFEEEKDDVSDQSLEAKVRELEEKLRQRDDAHATMLRNIAQEREAEQQSFQKKLEELRSKNLELKNIVENPRRAYSGSADQKGKLRERGYRLNAGDLYVEDDTGDIFSYSESGTWIMLHHGRTRSLANQIKSYESSIQELQKTIESAREEYRKRQREHEEQLSAARGQITAMANESSERTAESQRKNKALGENLFDAQRARDDLRDRCKRLEGELEKAQLDREDLRKGVKLLREQLYEPPPVLRSEWIDGAPGEKLPNELRWIQQDPKTGRMYYCTDDGNSLAMNLEGRGRVHEAERIDLISKIMTWEKYTPQVFHGDYDENSKIDVSLSMPAGSLLQDERTGKVFCLTTNGVKPLVSLLGFGEQHREAMNVLEVETERLQTRADGLESILTSPTKRPLLQGAIVDTVKRDATAASWRIAGRQFVRLARDPLVAILARHLAPDSKKGRAKIAAFLSTEAGEAMLAAVLSAALLAAPRDENNLTERLSKELRVASMAGVADLLAEIVMGPLRAMIAMGIMFPSADEGSEPASLPDGERLDAEAVVEEEKVHT